MTQVLERAGAYLAHFEQLEQGRSTAADPDWLRRLRQRGIDRFGDVGLPSTRDEEWRFTSVAPIAATTFAPAWSVAPRLTAATMSGYDLPGRRGCRLVFVGGRFLPELSDGADLDAGVRVLGLSQALASQGAALEQHLGRLAHLDANPFTALNTSFVHDVAVVLVPANVVVEAPIHLVFVGAETEPPGRALVAHPRVLVVAEPNSQVRVVESYVGSGGAVTLTNGVTEVVLGENAVVDHYKHQQEHSEAFHVGAMYVELARSSNFSSHSLALGGALVRNDVTAVLDGEGACCTLNGLYLVDGRRLIDNHTTIDHARPHCESHEIYKGILSGAARGVFNGKIIVRPDAQKTDAKQTNKALLLSDDAQIHTKPQLEIFADDVRCTHGATVGQLDDEALFYLRSRGIGHKDALSLLIRAFASDIVGRVKVDGLRARLERALLDLLPEAATLGGPRSEAS